MNLKSNLLLPVLFASLFGLSACGQTGPLYLPQSEQEAADAAAAASEQNADSEVDSEDRDDEETEEEATE